MKAGQRLWLSLLLLVWCSALHAGRACETKPLAPEALREAAQSAQAVRAALEQQGRALAIIARVGQDLRERGLVYSHAGFVMREHAQGRWTVVHLLNECGSQRGQLYQEGLVNFFADQPFSYQAKVLWLTPEYEAQVLARLQDGSEVRVFDPHYSVIARPDSPRRQNSTGWLLEVLATGLYQGKVNRKLAQHTLEAHDYRPDIVQISYGKRVLGGLFQANADFLDHPLSARLSGKYRVTTVRSIFRFLQDEGLAGPSVVLRDAGMRGD